MSNLETHYHYQPINQSKQIVKIVLWLDGNNVNEWLGSSKQDAQSYFRMFVSFSDIHVAGQGTTVAETFADVSFFVVFVSVHTSI